MFSVGDAVRNTAPWFRGIPNIGIVDKVESDRVHVRKMTTGMAQDFRTQWWRKEYIELLTNQDDPLLCAYRKQLGIEAPSNHVRTRLTPGKTYLVTSDHLSVKATFIGWERAYGSDKDIAMFDHMLLNTEGGFEFELYDGQLEFLTGRQPTGGE